MNKTTFQISQEHIVQAINLIPDGVKFTLGGVKTNPMVIALTVDRMTNRQFGIFREEISKYTVPMF